ncbi:hypothetical protein Sdagh_48650 [Streptomyces daghestanicus]|uniref:Transcriptional regulator n=1 Tax=Streptomyces daghestanicus TaxID=66885 RepID=A0ABQ3Q775_9ACTN|nr:hypothetical protein [Streptomyces daghestanicus]GHI33135.1 hypothetical protein Sdagh_48650 [Streptomyces daghestanicus]
MVLACVPGEEHSLPIGALDAVLSERGLALRMLGAAVPARAPTAAVRRLGPVAVLLWAQARHPVAVAPGPPCRGGPVARGRHPAPAPGAARRSRWAGRSGTGTARPSTLPEVLGSLAAASAAPLT